MRRRILLFSTALIAIFFMVFAPKGIAYDSALRVSDLNVLQTKDLTEELASRDIVFIGEAHVIKKHHEAQLAIIQALHYAQTPMAVGLEMFIAEQQDTLDAWVSGDIEEGQMKGIFKKNWTYDWSLYREIFLFAREHEIPLVGLNIPTEIIKKVGREGFASLTQEDLKRLPVGITCDVDDAYRDYIRIAHDMHDRKGRSFEHFCEAQLLWDKVMAYHLMEYLKEHPGTTMVVLAGFGHSWKKGIPEQVRRSSDYTFTVIYHLNPGLMPSDLNSDFYDYILN